MKLPRRKLLAGGGVAVAAGLAGCINLGPNKRTSLEATVATQFESAPPATIPVAVDVFVQNVDSRDVALRDVELVCYDVAREELASETLGDFSWRDAAPERRESEEHDSWLTSVTAYSADWTIETSIEVDSIPEWISFRVGEVWFGDDETHSQGAVVGTARASQPSPPLTATIARFASERPPSKTVNPEDYRVERIRSAIRPSDPLLPNPTTAAFWHARRDERRTQLEADIDAFTEDSTYRVDPSTVDDLRAGTSDALEGDRSDGPHLVEVPHAVAADLDGRGLLSDQRSALEVQPRNAFVDPAADAVTTDDRIVGLPSRLRTVALLYNRELVAEPPETVAELTAIVDRHHEPERGTYGLYYPLFSPFYYSAWIRAFGGYLYDAESESLGVTEPGTRRGIEFVVDGLSPYTPDSPPGSDDAERAFVTGTAPFAIEGPDFAAHAVANGIDVGVTTLPTPDAAEGPPSPFVTVDVLSFTTRLTDPGGRDATAGATGFAEWYATNETLQIRNANAHGTVPVSADALAADDLPATAAGFAASARMGRLEPPRSTMLALYPHLQRAVDSVRRGDSDATTALAEAEERIETGREFG